MKIQAFVMLFVLAAPAAHANLSVVCTAKGKATSNNGSGMLETDAKIAFDAEDFDPATDKIMTLHGVKGTIKVGSIDTSGALNEENAYIGQFKFTKKKSDPNYRPRRYRNMVRFKDFDAAETTGMESGMWGDFMIDKTLGDGVEAAYVFQAGDHMGGTVHFKCRVQD